MTTALVLAPFGVGLLLTIVLAARFTPRSWWRRANARAGLFLAAGTAVIGGALLLMLDPRTSARAAPAPLAAAAAEGPVAGAAYITWDDLNLRTSRSVGARRLGVVPKGAAVTALGERKGDWWHVSARIDGREVRGWASSLWLRRMEEAR